jgi:SAM-dependent methyltransferase
MGEKPKGFRGASNGVVLRALGLDPLQSARLQEHMSFTLKVLSERLERVDARLLQIEEKLGIALPFEVELPPTTLMDLVGGAASFNLAGTTMLTNLIELAGLKPDESVLDIGCGCGRTARHLVHYLSPEGKYRGFDIVAESVGWCQTHLGRAHPCFEFAHADIYNGLYNPTGTIAAESFSFPYENEVFDLAFLDSVFTHMFPVDVCHYLQELLRVLRSRGRALVSFFILDDTSRAAMRSSGTNLQFLHSGTGWYSVNREVPEGAIAYDIADVERMFVDQGLKVLKRRFGQWSGRSGPEVGNHQQDLYLVSKA